jgi:GTP-binding protein HflX
VINEFEVPPSRIVYVLNKVDATNAEEAFDKAGKLGILDTKSVVPVSAKTGFNIDQLRSIIRTRLFEETATEQEQVESAAVTAEEPEA